MEELNSRAGQHRISLVNREVCAINGVSDVLSFDVGGSASGDRAGDADDPRQ